jgi:hypothetical protein
MYPHVSKPNSLVGNPVERIARLASSTCVLPRLWQLIHAAQGLSRSSRAD